MSWKVQAWEAETAGRDPVKISAPTNKITFVSVVLVFLQASEIHVSKYLFIVAHKFSYLFIAEVFGHPRDTELEKSHL